VAQVLEWLLRKHKALSLNPSTAKKIIKNERKWNNFETQTVLDTHSPHPPNHKIPLKSPPLSEFISLFLTLGN
jgi:hypothetical protein